MTRAKTKHTKRTPSQNGQFFRVELLFGRDVPPLAAASLMGDSRAAAILSGLVGVIQAAEAAAKTETPMICACCDKPITGHVGPVALVCPIEWQGDGRIVLSPTRAECEDRQTYEQMLDAVTKTMARNLPGAREVSAANMFSEGSRA